MVGEGVTSREVFSHVHDFQVDRLVVVDPEDGVAVGQTVHHGVVAAGEVVEFDGLVRVDVDLGDLDRLGCALLRRGGVLGQVLLSCSQRQEQQGCAGDDGGASQEASVAVLQGSISHCCAVSVPADRAKYA